MPAGQDAISCELGYGDARKHIGVAHCFHLLSQNFESQYIIPGRGVSSPRINSSKMLPKEYSSLK